MIDNFYFGLKGTSAFVDKKDGSYEFFGIIDPVKSLIKTKYRNPHFQFFGIEDAVVNATATCHDGSTDDKPKEFLFKENGF